MDRPFRHIVADIRGDVAVLGLQHARLDEAELEELGAEIARLIDEKGISRLVLLLGPEEPFCLYSIFLAKLVTLQRRVKNAGGEVVMAQANEDTRRIFQATGLDRIFRFFDRTEDAVAALKDLA